MKSINWKVFLLSLAAQFLITLLLNLGIRAPQALGFFDVSRFNLKPATLASPVPGGALPGGQIEPANNFFEEIKSKLEQKKNDFQLKREVSFISPVSASGEYELASGYIVVDLDTGKVLAEKNASDRLRVASLTKVMTSVVAMDLAEAQEKFTVSSKAAAIIPTKIGVVSGQKMTLEELLNASLLTSANDAVQVIKEGVNRKYEQALFSGNKQDIFIRSMNTKAEILGLKNTHFENPQGFDGDAHFSSAEDLAILSQYALTNYPLIADIAKKDYQLLEANSDHKQFDLYNWNGLLGVYPGVYGLKIGNTGEAGNTTIVASERDGKKVLVVLLGAPGVLERDLWASQLLDLGFEKLGLDSIGITEAELRAKYSTWKYWG